MTVCRGSFKKLIEKHFFEHSSLYHSIAYRILRDSAAAEDACQQAFLKAIENSESIQRPEKLKSWLCRTVTNSALLEIRKQKRLVSDEKITSDISGRVVYDNSCERLILLEALGSLAENIRVVVVMRLLEEMSGNHVARILDISPVEVSRLMHQGMEQLRNYLHDKE